MRQTRQRVRTGLWDVASSRVYEYEAVIWICHGRLEAAPCQFAIAQLDLNLSGALIRSPCPELV